MLSKAHSSQKLNIRKKKFFKVLSKNSLSVINMQYATESCYINQERTGWDNVSLTNTLVNSPHQRPQFTLSVYSWIFSPSTLQAPVKVRTALLATASARGKGMKELSHTYHYQPLCNLFAAHIIIFHIKSIVRLNNIVHKASLPTDTHRNTFWHKIQMDNAGLLVLGKLWQLYHRVFCIHSFKLQWINIMIFISR